MVFQNQDTDDIGRKYLIVAALAETSKPLQASETAGSSKPGHETESMWKFDEAMKNVVERLGDINSKSTKNQTWVNFGNGENGEGTNISINIDYKDNIGKNIRSKRYQSLKEIFVEENNSSTKAPGNRRKTKANNTKNDTNINLKSKKHPADKSLLSWIADTTVEEALPFFVYEGSLPNPPCTGGVLWMISQKQLRISNDLEQSLKSFRLPTKQKLKGREIQSLNGRPVVSMSMKP